MTLSMLSSLIPCISREWNSGLFFFLEVKSSSHMQCKESIMFSIKGFLLYHCMCISPYSLLKEKEKYEGKVHLMQMNVSVSEMWMRKITIHVKRIRMHSFKGFRIIIAYVRDGTSLWHYYLASVLPY